MRARLATHRLLDLADKLDADVRLTLNDGIRLFECPDLLAVGWLANREREKRHAGRTYYNHNLRLEATNVCVASCLFCAFARLKPGDAGAYTMSLEQAWDKVRQRRHQSLTEVHVVNGLHPDLPFEFYVELLQGFKRIRPDVHLKCFTAVEIAFFADLYGRTDEQVLRELMDAGLDSMPGGGAEVFAERVRRKVCHDKCDADRWLSIHRIAHRLGMRSNVTMLYGHIETVEERVDHMLRARALQDETGGFQAFIPLALSSRQQSAAQAAGPHRRRHVAGTRRRPAPARQHCSREGVLDCDRGGRGADVALVRRGRPGRDGAGGADLPHGGGPHARIDDDRGDQPSHPGGWAGTGRA